MSKEELSTCSTGASSDENSRVKGYNELGFFQVFEVIGQATGFRGCDDTCIRVDRIPVRHIFVTR